MLKKLNGLLNIIIGSSIGVFLGHSIYVLWEYRKYPGLYDMQSAPWYTSIMVYGLTTVLILIITVAFKCIIRKKLRNQVSNL